MPRCLIETSDSDYDSESEVDYYNNYLEKSVAEINAHFKSKTNSWCQLYERIKISGEIKTMKHYYAFTIFDIIEGGESFKCKYMGNGSALSCKTLYDMYGSIQLGKYGLEFVVEYFVECEDSITKLETLKDICNKRGYFTNKRELDYDSITNVTILSKNGTQGYSDFREHLRLPLNIKLVSVCLEGDATKGDIVRALGKVSESSDLVIIMRGGGMTTDISLSFDHLEIFEAMNDCKVPVMTAIGHTKDCKDSLLITEVSDINCHTPTTAATYLNQKCTRIFASLYKRYVNEYLCILRDILSINKHQFNKCIQVEINSLEGRLRDVKAKYNSKLLASELIEIPHMNDTIFVRRGNGIVEYKLTEVKKLKVDVKQLDSVTALKLTSDVDSIPELLKSYDTEFLEVRNLIERNIQLTTNKRTYENVTPKEYGMSLISLNTKSENYKELLLNKRQLLYNLDKLDSFSSSKSDVLDVDIDTYNNLKVPVEITANSDIYTLLGLLKSLVLE